MFHLLCRNINRDSYSFCFSSNNFYSSFISRSFIEGGYKPDVSTHGSPRRTIVLTLAETGLHLFRHSLVRLGQSCVTLAVSSEAAVTAKATARGKPAATVPHVKYLLKRVQSVSALYAGSSTDVAPNMAEKLDQAVQLGKESQLVADNPVDEVQAWGTMAIALQLAGSDASSVVEAYLNAIGSSRRLPVAQVKEDEVVPLALFIQAARLLLLGGRFNQARTILLYACSLYSSATLFMLLGACYLRLDELENAEAALVEANLLDNRNPSVWPTCPWCVWPAGRTAWSRRKGPSSRPCGSARMMRKCCESSPLRSCPWTSCRSPRI